MFYMYWGADKSEYKVDDFRKILLWSLKNYSVNILKSDWIYKNLISTKLRLIHHIKWSEKPGMLFLKGKIDFWDA